MNAWLAAAALWLYLLLAYTLVLRRVPTLASDDTARPAWGTAAILAGLLGALTLAAFYVDAWALWHLNPIVERGHLVLAAAFAGMALLPWPWLYLSLWGLLRLGRPWLGGMSGRRSASSALTMAAWSSGLILIAALQLPRGFVLTTYDVGLPGLPRELEGTTILHLSDLHYASYSGGRLQARFRRLRRLHPDLVVVAGDFISHSPAWLGPAARLVRSIPARRYLAVEGNHDVWYLGQKAQDRIREEGLEVLWNDARPLAPGLWVAGVGDPYTGRDCLLDALRRVPPGAGVILLSHTPQPVYAASRAGVSLMLCGHTHGGQASLPGLGPLRTKTVAGDFPYLVGWHRQGPTRLFINRGLGELGPGLRLGVPPEAALLTLRRAPAREARP